MKIPKLFFKLFFIILSSTITNSQEISYLKTLTIYGTTSSPKVCDLDNDRYKDLFYLHRNPLNNNASIQILWGNGLMEWMDTSTYIIDSNDIFSSSFGGGNLRDYSSDLIDYGDWENDSDMDISCAFGILKNQGNRNFVWDFIDSSRTKFFCTNKLIKINDTIKLARGTTTGKIELIDMYYNSTFLPTLNNNITITEFVTGDFDHDGKIDFVGGDEFWSPDTTYYWKSSNNYTPNIINSPYFHCKEMEVGDINNDGFDDIVAQLNEFFSDFPSQTYVWLSSVDSFINSQVIYNFHNHNELATLGLFDRDSLLDYLTIGVDDPRIAYLLGTKNQVLSHNKDTIYSESNIKWLEVDAHTGIEIQLLNLNNDPDNEVLIRTYNTFFFAPDTTYFYIYDDNTLNKKIKEEKQIKIYPVPLKETLFIENIPNNAVVKLYCITGELLFEIKTFSNKLNINTEKLLGGLYLINIFSIDLNQTEIHKIIKK